jgi:branched-chain amino acid transport system permease protein
MQTFIQLTITGLANGAILALAAVGFAIIFKATGVINFAQGAFMAVGAYMVYTAIADLGWAWPVAVAFATVVAVAIGLGTERFVLRPMVGESAISVIMVTIGLAFFLEAALQFQFGTRPLRMAPFIPGGAVDVLGVALPANRLVAIGLAALVLGAVGAFFRYSRNGIAMRAVADDQQAALTMGISVRRIFAMAWGLSAITAMIAGVLVANIQGVSGGVAAFGLLVFPVVILGGLDSIGGTIVGGLIIGLLVQYSAGYLGGGLQQVVPYVLLLLILMVRPYGLFGEVRIERV